MNFSISRFWTFRLIRFAVILPILIGAVASFLLTACMPEWIDADSYMYVTIDGKVMVRDVISKRNEEITALEANTLKSEFPVQFLKLSPTKDRFVIARFADADKEPGLVFDFYSLSGMRIESSGPLKIGQGTEELNILNVNWSPDGKYVLATSMSQAFTVSYHTEKKTHRVHDCVGYMFAGYGRWPSTNPITPDSRSFIGQHTEEKLAFYIVSLETGEETHKFDMSGLPAETLASMRSNDPHVLLTASWQKNVLVQPILNGELELDVLDKSVDFMPTDRMKKLFDYAKSSGRVVVGEINENQVVEIKNTSKKGMAAHELSVYNFETKTRDKLDSLKSITMLKTTKSPDGERTMLSGVNNGQRVSVIVLNSGGGIVDNFEYPLVKPGK